MKPTPAALVTAKDDTQWVTESIVVALAEFDTELLRRVAARAEATAPGSWLPTMLRDYLESWRS